MLGAVMAVQQDYAGARTELARALEIDAGLLEAKGVLAQVHFKLGEWDYCIERGREYLKEKPEDSKVRLLVAQSLLREGRLDEAQEELEAIPAESRDGEILYALGRIQMGRRNPEAAREYLLAAYEMMPANPDILQSLIALERRQDRLGESKARIAAALEAEPENGKLHQLAGVVAMIENRRRRRRGELPKGHRARPGRPLRLPATGPLLRANGSARRDGPDLREGPRGESGSGPAPPLPRRALRALGRSRAGDRALRGGDPATGLSWRRPRTTSPTSTPTRGRTWTAPSTWPRTPRRCCPTTRALPTRWAGCSSSAAFPPRPSAI